MHCQKVARAFILVSMLTCRLVETNCSHSDVSILSRMLSFEGLYYCLKAGNVCFSGIWVLSWSVSMFEKRHSGRRETKKCTAKTWGLL